MKQFFYFCSLLICCIQTKATAQQAWNPFPQGQITYWNQSASVPAELYYCDSTYTDTTGRTVQLNGARYYRDLLYDNCEDTMYQQLSAWNPDVLPNIPIPDTFVYDNGLMYTQNGQQTIPFYYNADTNFTWTQLIGSTIADSVVWTCTNIFLDTILGFEDSIKSFTAVPYLAGIALADSQTILLSKQAGFLQYIPLSFAWDTLPIPLWTVLGFQHRIAGIFGFTSTSYDYALKPCAVGDVYIYEHLDSYSGSPNNWSYSHRRFFKDSIISFTETLDSFEYVVQHYPSLSIDTIHQSRQHPTTLYRYPNNSIAVNSFPVLYGNVQSYQYSLADSNWLGLAMNDGIDYDSAMCEIIIPVRRNPTMGKVWWRQQHQCQYLGTVADYDGCGDPGGSGSYNYHTVLLGYTRCGQSFGTTNYDSLQLVPIQKLTNNPNALSFKLYPNPSKEQITIEITFPMSSEPITIELYDILGQLVYTSQTSQNLHFLDIQHLASGTYTAQIRNEQNRVQQKFIKY